MAYRTTSWKNTDIGKIPSDWSVANLSDICDNYTGLTYSPKSVSESGTLVLRSSNINQGRLSFYDNVFVKMEIPNRAMAHDGDVLVCVRNGSARLIGKSAKVVGNGMAFGAFMTVLRANKCSQEFLLFLWQSFYIQEQIKITLGATINQITNGDIKNFVVPVPSTIPEQQKIADVLTDIDDLIVELERVKDKKIAIKTGVMQELLKPKECWISKKLDEVCDNIFAGGTPSTANEEFWKNGDIIWLPSGMVQDAVIKRQNANGRITAKGLANSSAKLIKAGTTILAMTGATCGKVAYLPFEAATNQSVMAFETTKISSKFLFYLLLNNKDYVLQFQAGGAQAGINKTSCKNFEFSFPPTKLEQEKIAQILSDMDDEISAISNKINKYKQIKSGVAGELLSGRIRLVKPQE